MNSLSTALKPHRHIRSFARRDSRITGGQQQAFNRLWSQWGLHSSAGLLNIETCFEREAPTILEIGFGGGDSLAEAAKLFPQYNFIGIETFKPGVGALLARIEALSLTNLRIYYEDAVEVLKKAIPDQSLQGLQLFFPDPWPKSRHHKRRLVQEEFVKSAVLKLKAQGLFHLATDWEDYAVKMMRVLSAETLLENTAGSHQYAERSPFRPVVTKFEGRGESEGRAIWELQFARL